MTQADHFLFLSLRDIPAVRAELESQFPADKSLEFAISELINSRNWRNKIIGGVAAYHFDLVNMINDIWVGIDNRNSVSWQFVIIAHELDSSFSEKAVIKIEKLVKVYKSRCKPINVMSGMTSIDRPNLALLYYSGAIDDFDSLRKLFDLESTSVRLLFDGFDRWSQQLRALGKFEGLICK